MIWLFLLRIALKPTEDGSVLEALAAGGLPNADYCMG